MAEFDLFGAPPAQPPAGDSPGVGNGALSGGEEDPAAAFLAQQESEIAGIENDEGFSILESGELPAGLQGHGGPAPDAVDGVMNGELYQLTNLSDLPRVLAGVKRKTNPASRLPARNGDANSRKQEAEWKEKAIKELEEWYARQDDQLQKTKVNNRVADEAFYKQPFADVIGYVTNINHPCYSLEQAAEEAFVNDVEETSPGTEWERVARLCDFNPKSSKQAKDVSRMRSILISLKQAPLVR
ncbi:phosphomannomutase 1 [Platysternon megacephalum]|uniref:Clathrin light chain n=1 Tax=Platysternon megacephalum TaxID=55544 RepID=A0A4D9ELW9_9SAUR|nr:phosphomannomutase 1 [Platysternon megacephalum]